MRQELLDELVSAAQEVVNDAEGPIPTVLDRVYTVGSEPVERLKAVVQAISDDAVAFVVSYAQDTRGEPVDWEQIERAVGHPFTIEEREAITKKREPERRPNYVADLVKEGLL